MMPQHMNWQLSAVRSTCHTFLQLSPFPRLFGGGFGKLLSMLCTDFSSLINPLVALHFLSR